MICGCTPSDYLSPTRSLCFLSLSLSLSLSLGLCAVDHDGVDGFDLGWREIVLESDDATVGHNAICGDLAPRLIARLHQTQPTPNERIFQAVSDRAETL